MEALRCFVLSHLCHPLARWRRWATFGPWEEMNTRQRRARGHVSPWQLTFTHTWHETSISYRRYLVSTYKWFADTNLSQYYARRRNLDVVRNNRGAWWTTPECNIRVRNKAIINTHNSASLPFYTSVSTSILPAIVNKQSRGYANVFEGTCQLRDIARQSALITLASSRERGRHEVVRTSQPKRTTRGGENFATEEESTGTTDAISLCRLSAGRGTVESLALRQRLTGLDRVGATERMRAIGFPKSRAGLEKYELKRTKLRARERAASRARLLLSEPPRTRIFDTLSPRPTRWR